MMHPSAFEIRNELRTMFEDIIKSGTKNFRAADKLLSPEVKQKSTVMARKDVWRVVKADKAFRGSTETAPEKPLVGGEVQAPDEKRDRLPERLFVITSAQNNTYLHDDFWNGLVRYANKRGARLLVSRFTYNKNAWRKISDLPEGVNAAEDTDGRWYDPRIVPYELDRQVKLADDLVFCGELDILPTAVTPLTGLQNYTGPNSGIVPHAKVHLNSLATMKDKPAKMMYTTGTATLRNYIDRRAGQVATFHHTFAALVVEVDEDGDWFVRQLIADDNGVFYDLDTAYGPNWDRPAKDFGETLVTLGDIHIEKADPVAGPAAIRMADAVGASQVFVHDLIDFTNRNHHNIKDAHFLVEQYHRGVKSVEHGMQAAASYLIVLARCLGNARIHVITSNHDQALERWLKDTSGFKDPINADYWCEANAQLMRSKRYGLDIDIFQWAVRYAADKGTAGGIPDRVHFVREDESVVINDIEHGMHGHRGPNGARGNPKAFRQMGDKVNSAHTHSAGIIDGVWTAGTLSKLDLGYNCGPSSWSHSSIITYPSGKRAIVTQRGSKWRG